MKKLSILFGSVFLFGSLLAGCSSDGEVVKEKSGEKKEVKSEETYSVAMVTDTGGIDDKSFNQSAWEGMTKYGEEFGLEEGKEFAYEQSESESDYTLNLNKLVRDKFDLIYGIGFMMAEDVKTIAELKKDSNFGIIDMVITDDEGNFLPNVANITFKEEQGSYLVGLVAGLETKANKIGFIGGVESDLIEKFEVGFIEGVKEANPNAEIMIKYAGTFTEGEKGKILAKEMYDNGADIIYHAAGGAGAGVFEEAKERKSSGENVWVIGVDRDQHEEGMPENVTLTSMVKRLDAAIYEVSKMSKDGNFPGGEIVTFGLDKDGVGIAQTTENLSDETIGVVEEYKQKIINGEIKVPTKRK